MKTYKQYLIENEEDGEPEITVYPDGSKKRVYPGGTIMWSDAKDKHHREDGPAFIGDEGTKIWYWHGFTLPEWDTVFGDFTDEQKWKFLRGDLDIVSYFPRLAPTKEMQEHGKLIY
jgi:hypothetical protein